MMEPKTTNFLAIIATALLFGSCYYDVEEEIYPTIDCQSSNMSYANDIQPLIQTNCYIYHAANINFGNITLDSYADLLFRVEDGRLLGAIKHQSGFAPMPQNSPKLLECQIEKIESWIAAGALNN